MSIVIFGMRGTSESQGLPPRRNVKKEESEGRTENVEGGWCVWCVCACVCVPERVRDGELERDGRCNRGGR